MEYTSLCDAYGVPPTPTPSAAIPGVATTTAPQADAAAKQKSIFKWIFYNMKPDQRLSVEQYVKPAELTEQVRMSLQRNGVEAGAVHHMHPLPVPCRSGTEPRHKTQTTACFSPSL